MDFDGNREQGCKKCRAGSNQGKVQVLIRERCRSGDCKARRGFCPRRLCPEYLAIGKLVSSDGELQLRDLGGKGGTDGAA